MVGMRFWSILTEQTKYKLLHFLNAGTQVSENFKQGLKSWSFSQLTATENSKIMPFQDLCEKKIQNYEHRNLI